MRTSRLFTFVLALLAFASLAAAAADARQERNVSGFNAVSLGVPARMEVIQGEREGLVLEGSEEDLARVETVVVDRTLRIRRKSDGSWINWNNMHRINVTLYARQLESLGISGSGRVHAATLRTPQLSVDVSGSGDVDMPSIDTQRASFSISGSGKMKVAGKASSLDMHISGSGDMLAEKLESREAKIHISGAGDAVVWVRDALSVRVAGSGDVRYYGNPTIEQRIAGSGSVKRLGAAPS